MREMDTDVSAQALEGSLSIRLPMPDARLSINGRRRAGHWSSISKLVRDHRFWAQVTANPRLIAPKAGPMFPAPARVAVEATFVFPRGARRDSAGLVERLKPYLDGFTDSGSVWHDDSQVDWIKTSVRVARGEESRVEITIRTSLGGQDGCGTEAEN